MGKIDKKKLLKEFKGRGQVDISWVKAVIGNATEQTPIDLDELYYEYNTTCRSTTNCNLCSFNTDKQALGEHCFYIFLKSKNLCSPAKRELPVKTVWKLKDIPKQFCKDFGFEALETSNREPDDNCKQYYDKTTEVDYSAIPKGSIVELKEPSGIKSVHIFTKIDKGVIYFNGFNYCNLDKIESIRVVEWGNE